MFRFGWNTGPGQWCRTQQKSVINSLIKEATTNSPHTHTRTHTHTHTHPTLALHPQALYMSSSLSSASHTLIDSSLPVSLFLYKSRWENTSLPPTGLNVVPVKSHSQHLFKSFLSEELAEEYYIRSADGSLPLRAPSHFQEHACCKTHKHARAHSRSPVCCVHISMQMHADSTHTHTCTNTDALKSIT